MYGSIGDFAWCNAIYCAFLCGRYNINGMYICIVIIHMCEH